MATRTQVEAHRRAVEDLVALAMRDLVAFWRAVSDADAPVVTAALREALPDLTAAYAASTAALAADFYDLLRDEAAVGGRYTAVLAPPPPPERAQALAGWAAAPLWSADPDRATALSRLAGGYQRVVADGARKTTTLNVGRDPATPRYARHATGSACAFCRMLATRGPVYLSEASADRSHDSCHCVALPEWDNSGVPHEEAPYVQGWRDAYYDARGEVGGQPKAILAEMRRTLGAK